MKKINLLTISKIILSLVLVLTPFFVFAQTTSSGSPINQGLQNVNSSNLFPNSNNTTTGTAIGLITFVIKIILFIAGALAVLFVVVGGIMYLTSAGNEEQATKGKKTITYALVGIIIIILSYVIVNVIVNLVECGLSAGGSIITGC